MLRCLLMLNSGCLTMSDMRALKCWMASSLLCCSLSLSISLVCSDRAFCTSLSLSLRLASMRACRSNSRSLSMSTFCKVQHSVGFTLRGNVTKKNNWHTALHLCHPNVSEAQQRHGWDNLTLRLFGTIQKNYSARRTSGLPGTNLSDIETSIGSYLGQFLHVMFVKFFPECRAVHSFVSRVCLQPLFHFAPPLACFNMLVT